MAAHQLSMFESANDGLETLLRRFPKIDLHVHLTGCVRLSTIEELIREHAVKLDKTVRSDLARAVVFNAPASSYGASFQPWKKVLNRISHLPAVGGRLLREAAEDFAQDGVIYAEVRVSPRLPLTQSEFAESLAVYDAVINEARDRLGIEMRLIFGFPRHSFYQYPPGVRESLVDDVLGVLEAFRGHTVVGFDLWGNEERHPPRLFKSSYDRIRRAGYPLTIHAGEIYSASSIRDAVTVLGCRRVGHGCSVTKDHTLCDLLRQRDVLVEACLTSNWITRAVKDLRTHPVATLLLAGVPVTLATDNTLVFNTSLSREVAKALRFGLIDVNQIPSLFSMAASYSFAPEPLRDALRRRIEVAYHADAIHDISRHVGSTSNSSIQ